LAPNIPPFDIHLCCSNIRHKTCFKAFQTLELYLGYCVKKNCTVTDKELTGDDIKATTLSDQEVKRKLDAPKNLHKSYFKLQITNELVNSKIKLL
jgi:hypothetical protein